MTARPWVSLSCLTGNPDACRLEHADGRRCANPAHTAYPDDLQPAGEQPTLDEPTTSTATPCAECGVTMLDHGRVTTHLYAEPTASGPRSSMGDRDDEPGSAHARAVESGQPAPAGPARRRRWRCPECGELVYRSEHVVGIDGRRGYACEVDTTKQPDPIPSADEHAEAIGRSYAADLEPDEPRGNPHNHEWPAEDPSTCACGAILNRRERTFTPAPEPPLGIGADVIGSSIPADMLDVHDQVAAAVAEANRYADEGDQPNAAAARAHAKRLQRGPVRVELTEAERRAVIHAHAILDPATALETAAELIRARLNPNP